jgi:hypothetical protein
MGELARVRLEPSDDKRFNGGVLVGNCYHHGSCSTDEYNSKSSRCFHGNVYRADVANIGKPLDANGKYIERGIGISTCQTTTVRCKQKKLFKYSFVTPENVHVLEEKKEQ